MSDPRPATVTVEIAGRIQKFADAVRSRKYLPSMIERGEIDRDAFWEAWFIMQAEIRSAIERPYR